MIYSIDKGPIIGLFETTQADLDAAKNQQTTAFQKSGTNIDSHSMVSGHIKEAAQAAHNKKLNNFHEKNGAQVIDSLESAKLKNFG